jgi:hypothetical protein
MSHNGSLVELVSNGKMDDDLLDLSGNSSLFNNKIIKKNKYSKGETIFYPEGNSNWGNTIRFNIERKGDLLYGLYLIITLPKLSVSNLNVNPKLNENDPEGNYRLKYVDYVGNVLLDKVSLYINGNLIDEITGDYMQVYIDLYVPDSNRKSMIGLDSVFNQPNLKISSETIYIPLKFWFTMTNEKPLPLIALQYSDIYIDVKFKNFNNCISVLEYNHNRSKLCYSNKTHKVISLEEVSLQANFYYVNEVEREKLAQQEYEIVITQSQYRTITLMNNALLDLNFNHIVRDMIFFIQPESHITYGEYFNFSGKLYFYPPELNNSNVINELYTLEPKRHLLKRARLLFDGIERIPWRDYKYFFLMQNHENYKNNIMHYIYMYSFNINPVKGDNFNGCNFSRLDNVQLQVEISQNPFILNSNNTITYPKYNNFILKCYITNFNILVIKNGLASLKYNN